MEDPGIIAYAPQPPPRMRALPNKPHASSKLSERRIQLASIQPQPI